MFPFIDFGFVAFPLHLMSPCSVAAARGQSSCPDTGNFTDTRDTHPGLFLILPVSFIHLGFSAIPWTLFCFEHWLPPITLPQIPLSPRLSAVLWVCAVPWSKPSSALSKALRPVVIFKLRTCWSAPLNRDQIIHVLKDKHLLKYFAESRPKHTH